MVPSAEARNPGRGRGKSALDPLGYLSGEVKGWVEVGEEMEDKENNLAEAQGRVSSIQKMLADSG